MVVLRSGISQQNDAASLPDVFERAHGYVGERSSTGGAEREVTAYNPTDDKPKRSS